MRRVVPAGKYTSNPKPKYSSKPQVAPPMAAPNPNVPVDARPMAPLTPPRMPPSMQPIPTGHNIDPGFVNSEKPNMDGLGQQKPYAPMNPAILQRLQAALGMSGQGPAFNSQTPSPNYLQQAQMIQQNYQQAQNMPQYLQQMQNMQRPAMMGMQPGLSPQAPGLQMQGFLQQPNKLGA